MFPIELGAGVPWKMLFGHFVIVVVPTLGGCAERTLIGSIVQQLGRQVS